MIMDFSRDCLSFVFILLFRFAPVYSETSYPKVFNVDAFGAKGDGRSNDQTAFLNAWNAACNSLSSSPVLYVPIGKTYLLPQTYFVGPCKGKITVQVQGTILAPGSVNAWRQYDTKTWIQFEKLEGAVIMGQGTFNANGYRWWICKRSGECPVAPGALTIKNSNYVKVVGLHFLNSSQCHVTAQSSRNIVFDDLKLDAPGDSPNTDGIHITSSQNVVIKNCQVHTGDDCVSIISSSSNILVKDFECGPGHGISIGSMGKYSSRDTITNIMVDGANLHGTTNGVRIKTWQGGQGAAANVIFQNVKMTNVANPIIVDQFYCNRRKPETCRNDTAGIQVRDIIFKNIMGTSSTKDAISLKCSDSVPCRDLTFENVDLRFASSTMQKRTGMQGSNKPGPLTGFFCNSAIAKSIGHVYPPSKCMSTSSESYSKGVSSSWSSDLPISFP